MAVEEASTKISTMWTDGDEGFQEFAIEIPDAEADEIKTVEQGANCSAPSTFSLIDTTVTLKLSIILLRHQMVSRSTYYSP